MKNGGSRHRPRARGARLEEKPLESPGGIAVKTPVKRRFARRKRHRARGMMCAALMWIMTLRYGIAAREPFSSDAPMR